jgi:pimeloyl-ACP methyl ester carboxylesterase
LRGRGESDDAKDPATYQPAQYVADLNALLEQASIARFVAIGTSLGGIIAMLLAAENAARIVGAVINDIGPVVDDAGVARIRSYVGQGRTFPSWMHAARALRETNAVVHPGYSIGDWLRTAKRMMSVGGNGRIAFDYDMKIAEVFKAPAADPPLPDLWPAWRTLGGRPVLVLRGVLSDLLSPKTFARMGKEVPEAELVTVADTGHAPWLDEPEARAAIARLLAKCA